MGDPFSALGIAVNLIAVIDVGVKVGKACLSAYEATKNQSEEINAARELATNLQGALSRIDTQRQTGRGNGAGAGPAGSASSGPSTTLMSQPGVDTLQNLVSKCTDASRALVKKVDEFDAAGAGRRRRFKLAMKVLKDTLLTREMKGLVEKLESYRSQLDTQVLCSIRTEVIQQVKSSSEFQLRFNAFEQSAIRLLQQGETSSAVILSSIERLGQTIQSDGELTRKTVGDDGAQTRALIKAQWQPPLKNDHSAMLMTELRYPDAQRRFHEVTVSFRDTSDWILDPLDTIDGSGSEQDVSYYEQSELSKANRASAAPWLQGHSDSFIFWLAGKPGSGKSTLVKHLLMSKVCTRYLTTWANSCGSKLVIATHFFWALGPRTQKTSEGMLRSLLYQVLKCLPAEQERVFDDLTSTTEGWYEAQLIHLFENLFHTDNPTFNIQLFVDGLDECEPSLDELVKTLWRLIDIGRGRLRIFCSSRPWTVFQDAFQHTERTEVVYLHEHSASDIQKYVAGKLQESSLFRDLTARNRGGAENLLDHFVRGADGSFVWVELSIIQVLKHLRSGTATFKSLHTTLYEIPSQLTKLYDHILDRIDHDFVGRSGVMLLLYSFARSVVKGSLSYKTASVVVIAFFSITEQVTPEQVLSTRPLPSSTATLPELELLIENCTGGILSLRSWGNERPPGIGVLHLTAERWLEQTSTEQKLYRISGIVKQEVVRALLLTLLSFDTSEYSDRLTSYSESVAHYLIMLQQVTTNFGNIVSKRMYSEYEHSLNQARGRNKSQGLVYLQQNGATIWAQITYMVLLHDDYRREGKWLEDDSLDLFCAPDFDLNSWCFFMGAGIAGMKGVENGKLPKESSLLRLGLIFSAWTRAGRRYRPLRVDDFKSISLNQNTWEVQMLFNINVQTYLVRLCLDTKRLESRDTMFSHRASSLSLWWQSSLGWIADHPPGFFLEHYAKVSSLLISEGGPRIEHSILPGNRSHPCDTPPAAIDIVPPVFLETLTEKGVYSGPIPSLEQWMDATARRQGALRYRQDGLLPWDFDRGTIDNIPTKRRSCPEFGEHLPRNWKDVFAHTTPCEI